MKSLLKAISYLSLLLMLVSCTLVFTGNIGPETNNTYLLVLTLVWFLSAPFWMGKETESEEEQV